MAPDRFRQLEDLYSELADLSPEERDRRLTALADTTLREELREMLDAAPDNELAEILASAASSVLQTRDPERFGPWRVTGILGRGGMGAVYRAVRDDGMYQREVAIKVLPSNFDSSIRRDRFLQERQILATLNHPNIAHMLDGGESASGSYIVLEYVDGVDIVSWCAARHVRLQDRLRLFLPVCAAVQYAHERGVIHRDIKPANVLVTKLGTPKLLDFGIAKLAERSTLETAAGFHAYTPQYASPEQVRGGPFTPATDVYALGSLLYELLTGARPHEVSSGDAAELVRVICEQTVPRPSAIVRNFPRELETILRKALQNDPARRYISVQALADDIQRFLEGKPILGRPDSPAYRLRKFLSRHRLASFATVGLTALLSLAVYFSNRRTPVSSPVVVPLTTVPGTELNPTFSPDGKQVAFAWDEDRGQFNIYTQTFDSTTPQQLTTGPGQKVDPAWSPDGRQIAYLRAMPNWTDLMIATVPGSPSQSSTLHTSERRLATLSVAEKVVSARYGISGFYGPAWSPDGKELAIADRCSSAQARCIYLVSVFTGKKRVLTGADLNPADDYAPAFSPDGSLLAFARSKSTNAADVYIARISGGEPTRLTFDNTGIEGIAWVHDGSELVFSSERAGGLKLWRISKSGGTPQPIDVASSHVLQPAISVDGRRLAFVENIVNRDIWRVAIHTATGKSGSKSKLIWSSRRDDSPRYSPDGRHLAFVSDRSGPWEIWISDADGSHPRQITSFKSGLTGSPRWSPDSRQIVFDSRQGGYSEIYIVPAAGGAPQLFTGKTSDNMLPAWSTDGEWIYFNSNRGSLRREIWKKRIRDGTTLQLTTHGAYEPYPSPDGHYVYFWKYNNGGVWRIPAQGGPEEPIPALAVYRNTRYFDVTNDGIYFVPHRDLPRLIQFFSLATGEVSTVTEIDAPLAMQPPGLSVSPDQKWIAYDQVAYQSSDIFVVQNFR